MEVLKFMNENKNWEEILTQPPYNIKVSRDNGYILLKYNQLSSDFTIPIVRECRGSIFWQNENGNYICVCRGFDKFGNYGESYVPEIDWSSAVVEEKVDGSLIKVWHHNDEWHVSTNGTIDAYKAEVDDMGLTFGDLFERTVNDKEFFCMKLKTNYTYMFELVSPDSRVVIPYEQTKLYILGCRDMQSMREYKLAYDFEMAFLCHIDYPHIYSLLTLEDCLKHVNTMTRDEEGFVVRDKHFNRMKIKSPEYLIAAQLRNNGAITTKRIIRMMQNNTIDDFMAYCPQHSDKVQVVLNHINHIANMMEKDWQSVMNIAVVDRKEFSCIATKYKTKDYLFAKYDDPQMKAFDWIMSRRTAAILRMMDEYERE